VIATTENTLGNPSPPGSEPTTVPSDHELNPSNLDASSTSFKFFTRSLKLIDAGPSNSTKKTVVLDPPNLIETFKDFQYCFMGSSGVWVVTLDAIHFWSIRLQNMYTIQLTPRPIEKIEKGLIHTNEDLYKSEESELGEILNIRVHPITKELVILDKTGKVFVCKPDIYKGVAVKKNLCIVSFFLIY